MRDEVRADASGCPGFRRPPESQQAPHDSTRNHCVNAKRLVPGGLTPMRGVVDTNRSLLASQASHGKFPRREQLRMTIAHGFGMSLRSLAALAISGGLCAALSSAPAFAQENAAQENTEQVRPPKLNYTAHTLPNGLQVILLEDHEVPIINLQVWYHVGGEGRTTRPHRLRASLRALDVQRLGARAGRRTFAHHRSRGRIRQRRNGRRHHEFLRDFPQQLSGARVVARSRPHGQPERQ